MVQFESLVSPLTPDDPCGPDLEYDKGFTDLERLGIGKPEQQVGSTIIPAEPPDWKQVEKHAVALFERTRDLRVTMWLTKSLLNLHGFVGLAQGLGVLHGLIQQHWEPVHPRLDPDDDNDPSMRVNIISELCDSAFINWVRQAPVVSSRAVGRYSMRDVAAASGEAPAEGGSAPEMSTIAAAFRASPPEDVQATLEAVRSARTRVYEIESMVTDQVGASNAADLSRIRQLLGSALKVIEQNLTASEEPAEAAPTQDGGDESQASGGVAAASGGGQTARLSGEISTRDDVLRALDKIIDYYERKEPASPIPLFIYRCRRMVNMKFLDIVRELTPDSVSHVETLVGRTKEEES